MNDVIDYFAPTKDSTNALRTMARQAFSETFAHLYDPIPFSQFLEQSYGVGGSMDRGLADPLVLWQAAAVGDQVIGYVKLTSLTLPAPAPKRSASVKRTTAPKPATAPKRSTAPKRAAAPKRSTVSNQPAAPEQPSVPAPDALAERSAADADSAPPAPESLLRDEVRSSARGGLHDPGRR